MQKLTELKEMFLYQWKNNRIALIALPFAIWFFGLGVAEGSFLLFLVLGAAVAGLIYGIVQTEVTRRKLK